MAKLCWSVYFPNSPSRETSQNTLYGRHLPLRVHFRAHIIDLALCQPHNHPRPQQLQGALLDLSHSGEKCLRSHQRKTITTEIVSKASDTNETLSWHVSDLQSSLKRSSELATQGHITASFSWDFLRIKWHIWSATYSVLHKLSIQIKSSLRYHQVGSWRAGNRAVLPRQGSGTVATSWTFQRACVGSNLNTGFSVQSV